MSIFTPNVTDLGRIVKNATVRQAIYLTYIVLIIIVGAATVAFATLAVGIPAWINVANAVLTYLGIPVGTLAAANIVSSHTSDATAPATVALSDTDRALITGVSAPATASDQATQVNPANL
jgi:hypothetical protein